MSHVFIELFDNKLPSAYFAWMEKCTIRFNNFSHIKRIVFYDVQFFVFRHNLYTISSDYAFFISVVSAKMYLHIIQTRSASNDIRSSILERWLAQVKYSCQQATKKVIMQTQYIRFTSYKTVSPRQCYVHIIGRRGSVVSYITLS